MQIKKIKDTPIQRLCDKFNDNTYFIKREDLIGFSFGGNKVRKAALFFEDIKLKNADCVITYGSSSSNHCRIISNLAAAEELPCFIISPTENNKPTFNSYLINVLGAKVIHTGVQNVSHTIEKVLHTLKKEGYKPYFIQGGGHGNIGTQAYVKVYQEIKEYEEENKVHFDYIFHASGTGTTQAGLVCGKIIHHDNRKIIGISIARRNPFGGKVVLNSVNEYLETNGFELVTDSEINFVDDYIVKGYGTYNNEIIQTIKNIFTSEGIPMDPTYTGKAFWGMKEFIKKNHIQGKNILFIHTGGTPLFFDNLEELINGGRNQHSDIKLWSEE